MGDGSSQIKAPLIKNDTSLRGEPLMIWEAEESEENKNFEALFQEKK